MPRLQLDLINALSLFVAFFCAITDVCSGKIYNKATYGAVVVGLLAGIIGGRTHFISSTSGLLIGGLIYYLAYRFGGLGAGDVKLMAAIGALKGLQFLLLSSFYVICAASVWGLFTLAWRGKLLSIFTVRQSAHGASENLSNYSMPFAPAIFTGVAYSIYLEKVFGLLQFGLGF